ncbi:hypothetical protein DCC39_01915 [Pueribacillus theae]|uniref:YqhP n=1 Tax=Pueribacillus theae TaxID=2171751 RepID=A0A2U1K6S2_9BACI|nr:SA1362 family protein [Pueribacillus theae]PWA13226.1 hypothetical protein DCC39_01915 [Pueribacillus theae]
MRFSRFVVPALVLFAVIGFASFLINEPLRLLRTIALYAIIIGGVYLIYRMFFRDKARGAADSNYQRAVKQSAKRQKQKQKVRTKAPHLRVIGSNKLKPRKPALLKKNEKHNFTVIEGKKNKKKNRALF